MTSRSHAYSHGYPAKSRAIPRASARQYTPRSIPIFLRNKDCGRSHRYVTLSSRLTSSLHSGDHRYITICAGATYLSWRHPRKLHVITRDRSHLYVTIALRRPPIPTSHVVITILYTCSTVITSPTIHPTLHTPISTPFPTTFFTLSRHWSQRLNYTRTKPPPTLLYSFFNIHLQTSSSTKRGCVPNSTATLLQYGGWSLNLHYKHHHLAANDYSHSETLPLPRVPSIAHTHTKLHGGTSTVKTDRVSTYTTILVL